MELIFTHGKLEWKWCCWMGFLECSKHMNELKPFTPSTKQITWEGKDGQERANILLNVKIQHYNTSFKLKHQGNLGYSTWVICN
jgi:hypothetical protein